jgi:hypothetical protein
MNVQGGTITGRAPVQMSIRFLVLVMAAVVAIGAGMAVIQVIRDGGAERLPATSVEGFWQPQVAHPAIRGRFGDGTEVGAVSVQRLYPGGFGRAAQAVPMPVQRLYPDGFGSAAQAVSMPVQRLYPDGFGEPKDDVGR